MIAGIHQPNFIPWIGYFYKIAKSDVFVLLDNVQYTKNSFINRNKIKTSQGEQWLTIPVLKGGLAQLISETYIQNKDHNLKKIIKTVEQNYKKATYFNQFFPEFENILNSYDDNLCNLNISLIKWIAQSLNIKTPIHISSELSNIEGTSTDRLVSICKELKADKYLSGFGGQNYQEEEIYKANNIELTITDFNHPVYEQLWKDFIPNMSIIDYLFNQDPCKYKELF